ncbi:MBL fold metallo-hydrolase [Chloroflexota bacterium]
MKLRVITLSENIAKSGDILGEAGLSILVETDEMNILLDTGKSISAAHNARTLNIDLTKIDKIVLSHNHSDHTGGLREILNRIGTKEIEVIAHPDVWAMKYRGQPPEQVSFTGIPFQRQELERCGAVFNLTAKPLRITNNIMTTGEIPLVTDFETIDQGDTRFIKDGSTYRVDQMLDDQAIIISTEKGLVIVTGCAHRGIINTLYHAQQLTGINRIYAVIGGSHLKYVPEIRIEQTIAALKELDIQKLGLCHCTGLHAIVRIAQELGEKSFFNTAGTCIDLL